MRGEICDCRRGAVRWSEWRCRLCRCLGSLVLRGEKSLQPSIVSSLFVRIEQAKAGYRNLIEELICKVGVFSLAHCASTRSAVRQRCRSHRDRPQKHRSRAGDNGAAAGPWEESQAICDRDRNRLQLAA